MCATAIQLSHEELLLVLGLLELPPPLALGPHPVDGYEALALGAALSAAGTSLVARELACPGATPGLPPIPAPALAMFARAVALAEGCLILAERRGPERQVAHLSRYGAELVLHTSPAPRVHRLAQLDDPGAATAWLTARIATTDRAGAPALHAPATALAGALDALEAGLPAAAQAQLVAAGVADAATFVAAVGPTPRRFALGVLRGLAGPAPEARGALALCGTAGLWWAESGPDWIGLTPLDLATLQAALTDLVTWM
jgi:hypothetical protein